MEVNILRRKSAKKVRVCQNQQQPAPPNVSKTEPPKNLPGPTKKACQKQQQSEPTHFPLTTYPLTYHIPPMTTTIPPSTSHSPQRTSHIPPRSPGRTSHKAVMTVCQKQQQPAALVVKSSMQRLLKGPAPPARTISRSRIISITNYSYTRILGACWAHTIRYSVHNSAVSEVMRC